MGLLAKLPAILEECKDEYQRNTTQAPTGFILTEQIGEGENRNTQFKNIFAKGDNAFFMDYLLKNRKLRSKLNLIYIDPPFYSKSDYGTQIRLESEKISKLPILKQTAYQDTWQNGMEDYLRMLTYRLLFMKDLLAEDGGIWVHLDWHVVHYVKIIMDEIFGEDNFINEVVWNYKSGGVSKRYFARKHDTLLYYSKTPNYYFKAQKEKSYNRGFKPYRFKGVKEYQDETGWYTMVNKKDVWQIDMVGRTSGERTGYATQKPELLIRNILESCTKEGDICADFFGGSGTLAAAAHKMGRAFIHCDIGSLSLAHTYKRLIFNKIPFQYYEWKRNPEGKIKRLEKTENQNEAKIEADFSKKKDSKGKTLFTVKLVSYVPCFSKIDILDEEHQKLLERVTKEEPLLLVDYWMIDFHYDGKTFKPTAYYKRLKKALEVEAQIDEEGISCVMLCVVDVFGSRTFCKMGE
ncbi:site-specific DNA-methyltransferase [Sinanaerobacter sp. ZZT-01]|uniref:site-specific DNA-methyltransferase n=1 Tax=Sinanaerobacter sp. ZZT-01 TaxID=3111540 RepID=UPI002D76F4A1|nr:site-specific DNA-methyltransferase [Sinanaerobacter sp. ZZT-01]WRR92562.1 site-specific DNA-methyltransferase [Sinanaerobacter sp. ZZT-01]